MLFLFPYNESEWGQEVVKLQKKTCPAGYCWLDLAYGIQSHHSLSLNGNKQLEHPVLLKSNPYMLMWNTATHAGFKALESG